MFCSEPDFKRLGIAERYHSLRHEVAKQCFDSWPRFNFDTLLDYAQRAGSQSEGAIFVGGSADGGCGDGGC